MSYKFFILFCLFLSVFGCKEHFSEKAKIITENKGTNVLYEEGDTTLIKIPLETTEEVLIGGYNKIIVNDSCIFILDIEKSKSVFIFDHAGRFKAKINRVGRGPGEFLLPNDFNLKGDTVLILDRASYKMLYFGLNGEFYKEIAFGGYRPIPFAVLDSDLLVFYYGMPEELLKQNAEVVVTDFANRITDQYIYRPDLVQKQGRFGLPYYFAVNQEGIYFIPVFEDKIYRLYRDSIKVVFDFDFKHLMYGFKDVEEKPMIEKDRKYSYFDQFFMTDDGTFICTISRGRYPINVCGNIYTGQLNTWDQGLRICGNYKNYFIAAITLDEETGEGLGKNKTIVFMDAKRLLK